MGRFLPEIFPVLETTARQSDDVELIENCLQCMESFVLRCPNEVAPYLEQCLAMGTCFTRWSGADTCSRLHIPLCARVRMGVRLCVSVYGRAHAYMRLSCMRVCIFPLTLCV